MKYSVIAGSLIIDSLIIGPTYMTPDEERFAAMICLKFLLQVTQQFWCGFTEKFLERFLLKLKKKKNQNLSVTSNYYHVRTESVMPIDRAYPPYIHIDAGNEKVFYIPGIPGPCNMYIHTNSTPLPLPPHLNLPLYSSYDCRPYVKV